MHLLPGVTKHELNNLLAPAKEGGTMTEKDRQILDARCDLIDWPPETRGRLPARAGHQHSGWTSEQRMRWIIISAVPCLMFILGVAQMVVLTVSREVNAMPCCIYLYVSNSS